MSMQQVDFRPAPFYFINDRLDREEIKIQLKLMKESGVSGFFIHPRAGNTEQPYGSRAWFEEIAFLVEEAERLSLDVWLYDEDPFPSGIAGGRVILDNPDYIAQALCVEKLEPDGNGLVSKVLGEVKILSAYAVQTDGKGEIVKKTDVSGDVGVVRSEWYKFKHKSSYYCDVIGKIRYDHWRAEMFFPKIKIYSRVTAPNTCVYVAYTKPHRNGDKFVFRPDNLNPACVKSFLAFTHERYREKFGEKFGRSIRGVFTDEPAAGGITPFTDALPARFEKEYGYSLSDSYMHLCYDFGAQSQKVRCDYLKLVEKLFSESFFKQIHRWCRQNKLSFTGHILAEEDPVDQALVGGNVYQGLWHTDIPGFDVVGNLLGNRDHIALAFGAKLAASVAHQRGINAVAGECLACNPFNFDLRAARRITDWLFCMDVNFMIPHGFFYAYGGDRKFDAGKSFFFQDPHFSEFPAYAREIGNAGKLLSRFRSAARVCLLNPTYGFYANMPADRPGAVALRDKLFTAVKRLFEEHIEFDVTDCTALSAAKVEKGRVKIGRKTYDTVVCVSDSSAPMLAFYDSLRARGVPLTEAENISELQGYALPVSAEFGSAKDLFVLQKEKGGEKLFYVFNNCAESVSFRADFGKNLCLFDPSGGEYFAVEEGAKIRLRGFGSAILLAAKSPKKYPAYRTDESVRAGEKTVYEYETDPQWEYLPPVPVQRVLTEYDAVLEREGFRRELRNVKYERLRYLLGTDERGMKKERAGFDFAELPPAIYPLRATFTCQFDGTGLKKPALLLEEEGLLGDYQIFINGKAAGTPVPKRVYDLTNLVLDVSALVADGQNELKIVFSEAGEFEGINSAIYVTDLLSWRER